MELEILTTKEVAGQLRISPDYVRDLIRRKKLRAYSEGRRGGYRILQMEVDDYVERKLKKEER